MEKCPDVACVDSQWSLWQTTIARAQEAGRPISEEVQEAVQDMIADRREKLDKKAAEAPVDGAPA
ncbi:hypothetical protein [Acetobacter sp. A11-2]|uniref:hypothetical protein n=1 Tax=Acetobacter sp. A11-2 TaxID=3157859 RepID=UPI0032EB0284